MAVDILGDASQVPEPDDAPQVGIPPRRSLDELKASMRLRVQNPEAQQPDQSGLDDMLGHLAKVASPPKPEHVWSGAGTAAAAGAAGLGAQAAGALEYGASRIYGPQDSFTGAFHDARTGLQNAQQHEINKLTPEEQDEMSRQWMSLDPHQTIWQGGASQFVHSLVLQSAQALPATVATLWPAARLAKAGMGAGALTYIGATQAGLSTGQIANNIADDIGKADENTLRQNSPAYAQMIQQGMDPAQARQELITKAQRYAPVVGGVVVGGISALAGRFLTPVLSKEGASLAARVGGGAADQALQGAGTAGADYVARESAAGTYDKSRAPDMEHALPEMGEAALTGAVTGSGMGVFMGHGKHPAQETLPNQQNPGEEHSSMESTGQPAPGAGSEDHTSGPGVQEDIPPERNREGFETLGGGEPHIITPGQTEMDLPQGPSGVSPDLAAAVQARHGDVSHWAEEQGSGYQGAPPPEAQPEEPPWAAQQAIAQRQEQLPLQGGQMNPPRPGPEAGMVPQPAQMNLPLRERQRGGVSQPPVAGPQRDMTVADQLRQRANPDVNQTDMFGGNPQGEPGPTTASHQEVAQQLDDLVDPSHPRQGVLLDAGTLEHLRQAGTLDQVREALGDHEMVPDFDRKGGALVAKPDVAAEAVQLRDNNVGTPEEIAEHLGHSEPDQSPAAVLQRAGKLGTEREQGAYDKGTRDTSAVVRRATERNVQDEALVDRTRGAAARDLGTGRESLPVSPREASSRLTEEARRVHNEVRERSWGRGGFPHPDDVAFVSPRAQERYRELDHELAGSDVMRNTAKTPEEVAHAKAGVQAVEHKIATFLKTHSHETKSEQVARAAVEVSPEGVKDYLKSKRQVRTEPLQRVEHPELTEAARAPRPSADEVRDMNESELEHHYEDAVARAEQRPTLKENRLSADDMRAEDQGVRSKMEKRINRVNRTEAKDAEMAGAKSEKIATSPRRALTERETRINESKAGTRKTRMVGYKTFDPEALLSTVESQREMERHQALSPADQRSERLEHYQNLDKSIKTAEGHLEKLGKLKKDDLDGNSPLVAQKYLRELLQYGRVLKGQSLRSPEARAAARKFSTLMESLGKKAPKDQAKYLINTFKTELARQDRSAMRASNWRTDEAPNRDTQIEQENARTAAKAEAHAPFTGDDAFIKNLDREIAVDNERLRWDRPGDMVQHLEEGEMSPYQLRHENAVAARRAEEGAFDEVPTSDFAGRQAEHEGVLARRQRDLGFEQKPTQLQQASRNVADRLETAFANNHGVKAPQLLTQLTSDLPQGSALHKLFTNLSRVVDKNALVGYSNEFASNDVNAHVSWREDGPVVRINRDWLENMRASGQSPEFPLLHALGHELTHIATSRAIEANPLVKERLTGILQAVRQAEGANKFYAIKNVHEMVAEAYSNRSFQQFLDGVEYGPAKRSLWDRFKQIVSDVIGFRSNDLHYSALDAIMREHGSIFRGEMYSKTPGARVMETMHMEDDPDGKHVGNGFDRMTKSLKFDKQTMHNLAADATQGAGQYGLSAMTPRQQSAQFSKYFVRADGTNPYKRYWDTFFKRASDNAVSMEKVGKLSNTWSNLEERYGNDTANKVSKLMHDATLYQFHPDVPVGDKLNEHLTSPEQQDRQRVGAAEFKKLPPEWQAHYKTMRDYYANEQRNTTDQIVLNGLHAMLTKGDDATMTPKEFDSKYDAATVRQLKLDTEEGLSKEFGDNLSDASKDVLTKIGAITNRNGPYFPLMRNGDYVVTAKRQIGSKMFGDSESANKYMAEQRAKDPTLSIALKKTEEGEYRVTSHEREVRMAEKKSEANEHRRQLVAQYGEENTTPVQLKADYYRGQASITTNSALNSIMTRLEGNPAAQNAIKDFYLRSLGEQSFRKRELARSNVRGVLLENQHRSFTQYGRSQSYYLAQLKWGRHLANAQAEVHDTVREHRDESQVSAVRLGEFARELKLRDDISQNPYKVGELVKKGTALTQFMMITSPSHWFVRGAQPWVLSAPWLGARHGYSESVAALSRAQGLIADPMMSETASSGLGLKALFSRAAAEKSYSVIDSVLNHIRARGGPDAENIATMVQHLRDNNLIDLSMATELSDIAKGKSTGLKARVLDASRVMLHLIEVNNRVMTAVAARELAIKKGATEAEATEHAADAINVTHNDYSYGNTPRMFMAQNKGMLGGARPLMFQFMKYPQQVYGLMISSGLQALKGKTPQERAVGIKTLAGVLATHMLAAGALGATIQPIKWAYGTLLAGASAAGMTSQPYTLANAFSGDTYDQHIREVMSELFGSEMGEVASKGLPAAVGLDLSQRMALGSLYSFHLKTDSDASTIGSLAEAFGGPWLNVGENFYDGGKKILGGDVAGGLQNLTPHILRDLVKAGMMTQKGVVDSSGRTLIPADQLSAPQIAAQALGFRPEQIAETQSRNNAERTTLLNIMDQRKDLLKQYAGAEPSDRATLQDKIKDFNSKHPGFYIDGSSQIKALATKRQGDAELQKYGVRAKAKQLPEVTAPGTAYNVAP